MSRFVEVTLASGVLDGITDKQWVNLEHVWTICERIEGGARITFVDDSWFDVKETPKDILSLGGT